MTTSEEVRSVLAETAVISARYALGAMLLWACASEANSALHPGSCFLVDR